jgi:hypothetical protein
MPARTRISGMTKFSISMKAIIIRRLKNMKSAKDLTVTPLSRITAKRQAAVSISTTGYLNEIPLPQFLHFPNNIM